jgi:nucleolar protein TMA23
MNAQAHLLAQGWAGPGHSLPSSSGSGLSRPLLVAQKQNNLGLGKKKFDLADQWWLRAFDDSLKGINSTTGGAPESANVETEIRVVQTRAGGDLDMVRSGGGKWVGRGGLYGRFVKGEVLGGTFEEQEEGRIKRRKVELEVEVNLEEKHQRKARKNMNPDSKPRKVQQRAESLGSEDQLALKSQPTKSLSVLPEDVPHEAAAESKEERRKRKAERRALKADRSKVASCPTPSNSLELKGTGRDVVPTEDDRKPQLSRKRRKKEKRP